MTIGDSMECVLAVSWRLTYPWNLLGVPAMTVTCGVDSAGLPIGVQVTGAAFGEDKILRCAAASEQACGGHAAKADLH